jgi:dynein heavy chain 1, cytosolic
MSIISIPLLNKELQRTGGRVLVRIGTEDIDFRLNFNIILSTENPAVHLTPDVASRVTIVNFTVTPASLESQSLNKVLQYEKPELELQRAAVLKLQGEQNAKLRELEDEMLAKISACEGSILEDATISQLTHATINQFTDSWAMPGILQEIISI